MNLEGISRLLAPIKSKIFLLIGRAILSAIDNSGKTQTVQVKILKDEVATGVERLQEYGFESYPKTGSSEAIILSLNGSRDNGVVIVIHDKEYRPKDLSSGDVCVYDYRGSRVSLVSAGIELKANGGADPSELMFLAETAKGEFQKTLDALTELQSAMSSWVPAPFDGGAALKAKIGTFSTMPLGDYSNILSNKVKNN